jgi:predicted O-linked N-acetylglucosamine transferase (SPINDLY family)
LRIGYISSFFHAPHWMKPVWALINRHDRDAFVVHLIADATPEECEASGYKSDARDKFLSIRGVDNDRAAAQIASLDLDLLIDLNSYSRPQRLDILAYRPARTVAAWFNQYATSGMPCYDYLIGDPVVIRPEEEPFYTEKIVRVSTTYLTYEVSYPVPPVSAAPAKTNGFVTFGCFASQYKLTPQVISAWCTILRGAPRARLLIKNGTMAVDSNRAALLARFTVNGIDPARIDFEPGAPHFDYLAAYGKVDIALDPFPYNGGTTTSEALWQGVPVLCFDGDRWASRQGASLLRAAGLDGFVARDEADYIGRAIAFGNIGVPNERETMRDRLAASKMMDTAGFTREMESIYRRLIGTES